MDSISVDIVVKNIFAIAFLIAFVADTSLLYLISSHVHDLGNSYYTFHKKMGLVKVTVLKIAVILWIIYSLIFEPSGKSGSIFTIITAYSIIVIKLFADYRKAIIKQQ